jgi:hypothetical protein
MTVQHSFWSISRWHFSRKTAELVLPEINFIKRDCACRLTVSHISEPDRSIDASVYLRYRKVSYVGF